MKKRAPFLYCDKKFYIIGNPEPYFMSSLKYTYMKRLLLLFTVILFSAVQKPVKASHLLGGEVSWECITQGTNAGKLIFTIKLYRACVGIQLPASATINNPLYQANGGAATIVCSRTEQNDLAPDCYDSTLQMDCATGSQRANVMEEHVYVSGAVQINGTPATTGSAFWYSSCCRPSTIYMRKYYRVRLLVKSYHVSLYRPCDWRNSFIGLYHGWCNVL